MQSAAKVPEAGDPSREGRGIQKHRTGWDYKAGHRHTLTCGLGERLGRREAHCFRPGVGSLLNPRQTISLCWLSLPEQLRAVMAQM